MQRRLTDICRSRANPAAGNAALTRLGCACPAAGREPPATGHSALVVDAPAHDRAGYGTVVRGTIPSDRSSAISLANRDVSTERRAAEHRRRSRERRLLSI